MHYHFYMLHCFHVKKKIFIVLTEIRANNSMNNIPPWHMDLSNIHKWLAKQTKIIIIGKKQKSCLFGSTHNLNNKIGNRPVEK